MTEETQLSEKTSVQTDSQSNISDSLKSRDIKKEKCRPMTKVVIRRLPPSMTQEQFMEQVSPLPEHDYLYFVKADMSLGQFAFSRAYINFTNQQEIFIFREKFDNYVFVDAKGTEYPAVVEFSPFQRLPKKRVGKKKEPKCGTIETDPYYISFLECLKSAEAETGTSQPKTEYSYTPSDSNLKKVTTTPLLDFLKQRKLEKQRIREEKREERRRRDLERKRIKEEPTVSKVLKNPDQEKEASKENKENKEEKEKAAPKDAKSRLKKDDKFRDKQREREVKTSVKGYKEREREAKQGKKYDEKKSFYGKKDDRDNCKDERKHERKEDAEDRKVEEKKGKSYEKMRQEKKRLAESKKQSTETSADTLKKDESEIDKEKPIKSEAHPKKAQNRKPFEAEDKNVKADTEKAIHKSLENLNVENERLPSNFKDEDSEEKEKSKSNEKIDRKNAEQKRETKVVKRRNSLESGGEGVGSDGSCLRRHKSLDGGDQSNLQKSNYKGKDKKDPRLERRIRNKDRPAMEIYRPGMGKFSKQRLEREKTSDDRASLSESPTPVSGSATTSKNNKSEVRSMTFKRSFNRDNS